ncbi:MAG: ribosome recycling factor [Bacteroidetes bacterium]|nr:ribosome recycling factor [Bacteroidota bacterium]
MNANAQLAVDSAKEQMDKAISHLENEISKIRTGRANPSMLESIRVDYYGNMTPLSQVANVSSPEARTLMVQPWEKSMLDPIQKAIHAANLGFNPGNNGTAVIISVPALTEDRRKDLVKKAKAEGENAKVSIRKARQEGNEAVKKITKPALTLDETKEAEAKIQELTNSYITKVDKHLEQKEKEIMTV